MALLTACRFILGITSRAEEPDDGGALVDSDVSQSDSAVDAGPPPCLALGCVPTSCKGDGGRGTGRECGKTGDVDCCETIALDGGYFAAVIAQADGGDAGATADAGLTFVSPFRLDKFEATVGRVKAFVEAGYGTLQHPPLDDQGKNPNVPFTGWSSK